MSRRIVISEQPSSAGELADMDRLLIGHPGEDRVPPIRRATTGRDMDLRPAELRTLHLPEADHDHRTC